MVKPIMKTSDFISQLDENRIVETIRQAEARTTGEIRVFVSRRNVTDAVKAAERHFTRLGMERTRQRNGVLIFIAPRARKFAIIGDDAIHAAGGDHLWWRAVSHMEPALRSGHCTDAILSAIAEIGEALAEHFPGQGPNGNELSDKVAID
jgi:uncharacterized membrane protein